MAGKFEYKYFKDIDISDCFFDSLKLDYPGTENSTGFVEWFKAKSDRRALVYYDDVGILAFIALKDENESVELKHKVLPPKERKKISTIKISERHQGERYGEGAIGLMLWKWQESRKEEIYVTVFERHQNLIIELERFGFKREGYNLNDEMVLIKNRKNIDFSDPYKSFPFIKGGFEHAGYLIFNAIFHDNMFAYSELANKESLQERVGKNVINGITKIYIGKAATVNHKIGEPILIYRKDSTDGSGKRYRSCITSYAVITDIIIPKSRGNYFMSFEELLKRIGNKSVFNREDLRKQYEENTNVLIISLLYMGYFGPGNNVNLDWLERNDCWKDNPNQYPTSIHLTEDKFRMILKEGNVDVSNVIID